MEREEEKAKRLPQRLKVGDRIKFVSIPDEWRKPDKTVQKECMQFMKVMIRRRRSSRSVRPAMWMGCKSLTALENVLAGISLAQHFYDTPKDWVFTGFNFEAFEKWADGHFN